MDEPPAARPSDQPASSFEERLRTAREKQGLEPRAKNHGGGMGWAERPLATGFRVAGELVAALAVSVAIGWWLDRWLGTAPWLLVLFLVLGSAAGVLNVWRLFAPDGDDQSRPGKSGPAPKA